MLTCRSNKVSFASLSFVFASIFNYFNLLILLLNLVDKFSHTSSEVQCLLKCCVAARLHRKRSGSLALQGKLRAINNSYTSLSSQQQRKP